MNDRDPKKFTLWWNSSDGQASMFGVNYDSKDAARAAIPEVEQEFRAECNSDSPYDERSTWSVQEPEEFPFLNDPALWKRDRDISQMPVINGFLIGEVGTNKLEFSGRVRFMGPCTRPVFYHEVGLMPCPGGFGEWQRSGEPEGLFEDPEEVIADLDTTVFEIGVDALPDGIEDLRGKIRDEPARVFGYLDEMGTAHYFGFDPADPESDDDPELPGSIMTRTGLAVYVNLSDPASSIRYADADTVELDDPYSPGWRESPFQASQVASLTEAFNLIDKWDP